MSDEISSEERQKVIMELEEAAYSAMSGGEVVASDDLFFEEDDVIVYEDGGDDIDDDDDDYVVSTRQKTVKKKSSKKETKKEREFSLKVSVCTEVRKYPELWSTVNKDYANKPLKDSIWVKVAKAVSSTVGRNETEDNCRKFWLALRESARNFIDKAKVKRLREKSGASADDLENDESSTIDVYQSRWPFAEHMNFFIPACARSATRISMGNSTMTSNLKRKTTETAPVEEDNVSDCCECFRLSMFYVGLLCIWCWIFVCRSLDTVFGTQECGLQMMYLRVFPFFRLSNLNFSLFDF